jgi:dienelactone hydrolase
VRSCRFSGWHPILALLICLTCCDAGQRDPISIPAADVPGSRMPGRPIPAVLSLPAGTGPFPAIILLHTCSGRSKLQEAWAARLNSWGYAVVIPDSFSPRWVTTVCSPSNQPLVTSQDRVGDVLSAALWLRTQPEIDGQRIGVLGNSHGGGTAARVTERRYEQLYPGLLKASVDYYGPCRFPEAHGTVPLLVLAGEDDDWGNPARTCAAFGKQLQADQPFELRTYPGVVHAFDNPRLNGRIVSEGYALQYDPAAAEDSFIHVKAFLDRYVGHPG